MLTNRNATEANGHAKPPATVPSVAPAAPRPVEGFHGANGYAKPPAPAPSVAPAAPKPVVGFHGANGYAKPPAPGPSVTPAPPKPVVGFHGAVGDFKRRLIEATLAQAGGNRTRAAGPRVAADVSLAADARVPDPLPGGFATASIRSQPARPSADRVNVGGHADRVTIRHADHLRERLAFRGIPAEVVEEIFRHAAERFRDVVTGHLVATARRQIAGSQRDVVVVYDEEPDGVVLITFHPLRANEKARRIAGGRWVPR